MKAKGLCNGHYLQKSKGKPLTPLRKIEKNAGKVCSWSTCSRNAAVKGYCNNHYQQYRRGEDLSDLREVSNPNWGSGKISGQYYVVYLPEHPNSRSDGYISRNRLVMSALLGRPLLDSECVHHKDGNSLNDAPENLELWTRSHPPGMRVEDIINYSLQMLELYMPSKLRIDEEDKSESDD